MSFYTDIKSNYEKQIKDRLALAEKYGQERYGVDSHGTSALQKHLNVIKRFDEDTLRKIGYDATSGGQKRGVWNEQYQGNLDDSGIVTAGLRLANKYSGIRQPYGKRYDPTDRYQTYAKSGADSSKIAGMGLDRDVYNTYQKLQSGAYGNFKGEPKKNLVSDRVGNKMKTRLEGYSSDALGTSVGSMFNKNKRFN